jgi:D-alanine-D-alanine ligase
MIHVEPNWWQSLFDDVYLLTDAPIVCNPALTKREVDVVKQVLRIRPSDHILDLCGGQGRHAIELARHGYQHLTVLDFAPLLLQRGRQEIIDTGLSMNFCRGDARTLPLRSSCMDVVLLMANSFGYFVDAAEDQRLLHEVARVLRRGGRLLLDLFDYDYTVRHFLPESWHEANDDVVVCWKRERVGDVIRVREMVLSKTKGLLRDRAYAERLYRPDRLHAMLEAVGFDNHKIHDNVLIYEPDDGRDYGLATHRMLITVTKT